tara:strand:+ start:56 stop:481 length:426 start_codon:yes stop_codon:yes gene_type:complete
MKKPFAILLLLFLLIISCAPILVRQKDLNAWVGVPVEALDLHSFWITIPMVKTKTDEGVEIRMYVNKNNVTNCFGAGRVNVSGYLNSSDFNQFNNCISREIGCDNIFYIKDGKVLEYVPVGNCYTSVFVQPEARYKRLIGN